MHYYVYEKASGMVKNGKDAENVWTHYWTGILSGPSKEIAIGVFVIFWLFGARQGPYFWQFFTRCDLNMLTFAKNTNRLFLESARTEFESMST